MSTNPATLVLNNGRLATMRSENDTAQAIAIRDQRIIAVGSNEEIAAHVGASTRVIDLGGRFVTPGLIDAHAHVELGSRARDIWTDIRGVTREQAITAIAEAARSLPRGDWIVAQATYRQDLPTRDDLDALLPDVPVVVRLSMHRLVANSAALAASGITRYSGDPAGSRIERDSSGTPTGIVEEGFDLMAIPPVEPGRLKDALERSLRTQFLAHGVTTVYELPASTDGMRAYQQLYRDGDLPVRLTLNPIVRPGHQPITGIAEFLSTGIQSGFGDDWLSVGALKIFVDGDDDAALWRHQLDRTPHEWGVATRTYQQLSAQVLEAFGAGLQLWIHAIGDVAQDMTLDAIEAARRVFPDLDARPRIEHIANSHWNPTYAERMSKAGIIPVPTAAFMHGGPTDSELDPPRERYVYRTLMEAGLRPPGNSDTAGTQPFATNPLHGMYCLVGRRNVRGEPIWPAEALSLRQALQVYTQNSAYAGFLETSRGSLEVGKLADLAVFDSDLDELDPSSYQDAAVDTTIIGGELVYER